jgi:hypothetical protein
VALSSRVILTVVVGGDDAGVTCNPGYKLLGLGTFLLSGLICVKE